jgi:hypothetical protein
MLTSASACTGVGWLAPSFSSLPSIKSATPRSFHDTLVRTKLDLTPVERCLAPISLPRLGRDRCTTARIAANSVETRCHQERPPSSRVNVERSWLSERTLCDPESESRRDMSADNVSAQEALLTP